MLSVEKRMHDKQNLCVVTRAVLGFRGFWVSRLMAYGCWVQGDCGIG